MKFLSLLIFFGFIFLDSSAQDINYFLNEGKRLEALPDEKGALKKFKDVLKLQPANLCALSKCSELCSRIGNREADTKSRDNYYAAAVIYAKTALKLSPADDEANTAMAIAVGRTVLIKSGKEKISAVKDIKHYADIALLTNPQNFKAWHILGKWNYEVSNLNMMEKAAAKIFFGGLPPASLTKAIASYEKAKTISPSFLLNYIELARAYNRHGDKNKALVQLKKLLTLPSLSEDDPRIKVEAQKLIKSWS